MSSVEIVNGQDQTLALLALAHVAGDEALGPRFLALSGMDADALRARAAEPVVLAAVIDFLCSHEADLIACAEALGVKPARLAAAGAALDPATHETSI